MEETAPISELSIVFSPLDKAIVMNEYLESLRGWVPSEHAMCRREFESVKEICQTDLSRNSFASFSELVRKTESSKRYRQGSKEHLEPKAVALKTCG